jgi:hypothetical protein
MLPEFPKTVVKEKVGRGHYRLTRDDGFTVEVKRCAGGWLFGGGGRKVKSIGLAEYDMRNGFTSHDQVSSTSRQAMRETAMGMRGYAGSPAQAEDRFPEHE